MPSANGQDAAKEMGALKRACLKDDPRNFWTVDYGLTTFGDLFTDRQLVALNTFSDLVHEAREVIEQDALAAGLSSDPTPLRDGGKAAKAYAEAVSVYLGVRDQPCLSDTGNNSVRWNPVGRRPKRSISLVGRPSQ